MTKQPIQPISVAKRYAQEVIRKVDPVDKMLTAHAQGMYKRRSLENKICTFPGIG